MRLRIQMAYGVDEMTGKGRKLLGAMVLSLTLLVGGAVPVLAAETPHVAKCAVEMGGRHVEQCAQTMDKGVSACAQAQ